MGKQLMNYIYYFRLASENHVERKYAVSKFADDSEAPIGVYNISIWKSNGHMSCNCPAAHHHARKGDCKHIGWFKRWIRLYTEKILKGTEIVRFETNKGKNGQFIREKAFDGSAIISLLEEDTSKG